MRVLFLGCWFVLSLYPRSYGCLWDRDTVAVEAKGVPEALDIIAGRFEQNPPLYFQIRRDRVLAALKRDPSDLSAYDDGAVASDRLGDDDQAIALMQEKSRQLANSNPPDKNSHLYRYEANIGTFYIHRWLRHGGDRTRISDVDLASQHIGEAIRINPNAHFGREKYQLLAINWIRNPPVVGREPGWFPSFLAPASTNKEPGKDEASEAIQWDIVLAGYGGKKALTAAGFGDAVQGLSGLISLGNAWQSIDVFYALGLALNIEGRSTIAFLAQLRIEELIDNGAHSLGEQQFAGKNLKDGFSILGSRLDSQRKPAIRALYSSLRASAEKWRSNRTAYMEQRLKQGSHPDTDPNFWADYRETPRPSLRTWHDLYADWHQGIQTSLFVTVPVILLLGLLRLARKIGRAITRAEES